MDNGATVCYKQGSYVAEHLGRLPWIFPPGAGGVEGAESYKNLGVFLSFSRPCSRNLCVSSFYFSPVHF